MGTVDFGSVTKLGWSSFMIYLHIKYVGGYMVFLTSLQSIMPIVLLISLGYFLKRAGHV